jgi:hypothetical protein
MQLFKQLLIDRGQSAQSLIHEKGKEEGRAVEQPLTSKFEQNTQ